MLDNYSSGDSNSDEIDVELVKNSIEADNVEDLKNIKLRTLMKKMKLMILKSKCNLFYLTRFMDSTQGSQKI